MILNMYSIFDTASGLYSRPFFGASHAESHRAFSDIALDANHPIGKHPEDYTLFLVGAFDDTTGKVKDVTNESLATALEAVAASRQIAPAQLDLVGHE